MGSNTSSEHGEYRVDGISCTIEWAYYSIQGHRRQMEDKVRVDIQSREREYLVASIFDGHYGDRAAKYAKMTLHSEILENTQFKKRKYKKALEKGYKSLDETFLGIAHENKWPDGTTALTALFTFSRLHPTLFIANIGDCRAVGVWDTGLCKSLTNDHTPNVLCEKKRIKDANGEVIFGRINGYLNVSRSFGDLPFKFPNPLIISTPEISKLTIEPSLLFVILASDGVWGYVTNLQVSRLVHLLRKDGYSAKVIVREIVQFALDEGSIDNISVFIAMFNFDNQDQDKIRDITIHSEDDKQGHEKKKVQKRYKAKSFSEVRSYSRGKESSN